MKLGLKNCSNVRDKKTYLYKIKNPVHHLITINHDTDK